MAALLHREWPDQEYGEGGQPLALVMVDLEIKYLRCGNEKPSGSLFQNDFNKNVKEIAH